MVILVKKTLKNWDIFSATSCHGDCHTGTETSHGVLKSDIRVQGTHTQFRHALNGLKRSSGVRDMNLFPNVATMLQHPRKRLRNMC